MQKSKWSLRLLVLSLCLFALAAHYALDPWGFYHSVASGEAALRLSLVEAAQAHLGQNEADGSYQAILSAYNAQASLPQGYTLQSEDSWCAAFVTVAALEAGLSDRIPPECSCGRQIDALSALGCWEERDDYLPAPGDLIFYDWQDRSLGDCQGWPDHVGIVVGIKWPFIKVIEGNRGDKVTYRRLLINSPCIRGFGVPDYSPLNTNGL